jgi:diguanylate cyclase (GGDEF)-like protein
MNKESSSFTRLLNAPTDIPAVLVIALGLAIALFFDDVPVRLIGVCIAILGSVGIAVMYSQRAKELAVLRSLEGTRPATKNVSEVTDFKTTVKQETGSKRLVFDDFSESFGDAPLQEADSAPAPRAGASTPTPSTPSKSSPPAQPSSKPSAPFTSAPAGSPPKTLVFDDFDDAADFNDMEEITLVTAPQKFTPSAPPPVIPKMEAAAGSSAGSPDATQGSGKKTLVFDDADERAGLHNDFTPKIPIGRAALPEDLQTKRPVPPPVTPPPPPVKTGEIAAGAFQPPKLDETLLGAEFDEEDGAEFRILGKSASAPAPLTVAESPAEKESVAKENINEKTPTETAEAKKKDENAPDNSREPEERRALEPEKTQEAEKLEQPEKLEKSEQSEKPEQTPQASAPTASVSGKTEPAEISATEDVQDKVTRAANAALKREQYATPQATAQASDLRAPQSPASTELPPEAVSHRRKKLTVQMDDIVEETPEQAKNEPRREFEFLLQRILLAIRSAMSARTTAYWWYAADGKRLTLEAKITDAQKELAKTTVFPLGENALSQIVQSGAPEILSDISPEAELQLLPYYAQPAKTRSFVGVPVYFNGAIVGLLTADSTDDDAYDNATVSFLGHFTKLIGGLIQSYTEKYDLLQSARALDAIDTFRQLTLKPDRTGEDVCTALIRSLMRLVPYTTMGTCIYGENRAEWYVSNLHTKFPAAKEILGGEVFLDNSLVGKTIANGRTYRFANPAPNFIRITANEQAIEKLAFTAVPLVSVSRCYGALFIEEHGETRLTKQDVEIMETVCEYAGTALEQMQLQEYVHTHALLQEASDNRLVSSADFTRRLGEEIERAKDVELSLSVALVGLDAYASFANDPGLVDELRRAFTQILLKHLRPYDVVCRYRDATLAICLIEKNSQAAQMWAERVRRETASASFAIGGKQYNVTASVGIAEYLKQQTAEETLAHAERALENALKKTNAVSIFS